MPVPIPLIALAVGGVSTVAGWIGSTIGGQHFENLSQEKQQEAILNSNLSEQGKQSALEALYGGGGDVIIGVNPTGGSDIDQRTTITGDGNTTNAEPTVTEPTHKGSDVPSFLSDVGTFVLPALVCGAGLFFLLKSSSSPSSGGYSRRYYSRGYSRGSSGGNYYYDNSGYYDYLDRRDERRFERQKWRYDNRRIRSSERRESRRDFDRRMKEQLRPYSERVKGWFANG